MSIESSMRFCFFSWWLVLFHGVHQGLFAVASVLGVGAIAAGKILHFLYIPLSHTST